MSATILQFPLRTSASGDSGAEQSAVDTASHVSGATYLARAKNPTSKALGSCVLRMTEDQRLTLLAYARGLLVGGARHG